MGSKKVISVVGAGVVSLMVLSGCGGLNSEKAVVIDKINNTSTKGGDTSKIRGKEVTESKINGKVYSDEELQEVITELSKRDTTAVGDKNTYLLQQVLKDLGVEGSKDYKSTYKTSLSEAVGKGEGLSDEDKEWLKTKILYQVGLPEVYKKVININKEEIEKEYASNVKGEGILQIGIDSSAVEADKNLPKKVYKAVKGLKGEKAIKRFISMYSDTSENQKGYEFGNKLDISINDTFNKYVVDEDSEIGKGLGEGVGYTYLLGEGSYQAVYRVLTKSRLTKDEIEDAVRNKIVRDKYKGVGKLLLDMEKNYNNIEFSDKLREKIKVGWAE